MNAGRVMRDLGISYRQLDYWLRRMGSVPGRGRPRDLSPDVAADLAAIFRAREKCQAEIDSILAAYDEAQNGGSAT